MNLVRDKLWLLVFINQLFILIHKWLVIQQEHLQNKMENCQSGTISLIFILGKKNNLIFQLTSNTFYIYLHVCIRWCVIARIWVTYLHVYVLNHRHALSIDKAAPRHHLHLHLLMHLFSWQTFVFFFNTSSVRRNILSTQTFPLTDQKYIEAEGDKTKNVLGLNTALQEYWTQWSQCKKSINRNLISLEICTNNNK